MSNGWKQIQGNNKPEPETLLTEARRVTAGQELSIVLLQKKMSIGYSIAKRLMELLQQSQGGAVQRD